MGAETTQQTEREIFSFTFMIRKEVKSLPSLIEAAQELLDDGYSCLMGISGRWIELNIYERNCSHPTFALNRLLMNSIPSKKEQNAIIKVNFAASCSAIVKLECTDSLSFTVKVFKPKNSFSQNKITQTFKIIDQSY